MSPVNSRRQLFKEGTWVSLGQIGSALGTLVGIRALTEFVAPEIFGAMTLFIGVTTLTLGTLLSPLMQATFRFYPEYSQGRASVLRASLKSILFRRFIFCLLALALSSPLIVRYFHVSYTVLLLSALLLVLDGLRTVETTLLNVARRRKTYALIAISESWGRPLLAIAALRLLDVSLEALFVGYATVTSCILIVFYLSGKPVGSAAAAPLPEAKGQIQELGGRLRRYTRPLLPMASLDWLSGQGDRYMIGMLLGLSSAGIYSAVYGVIARPFLMSAGIVETTLRPVYNQYVVSGNHLAAKLLIYKWIAIVLGISSIGLVTLTCLDEYVIGIVLSEQYRQAYRLVPWIAAGYSLLTLSRIFEIICYTYSKTSLVVGMEVVGTLLSISVGYLGIVNFGLLGAAMAIPVYFGLKLILSASCAYAVVKRGGGLTPAAGLLIKAQT